MDKNFQEKLFDKYPKIFRQKDLSMKETAMCWGISCGPGWYNILDCLCYRLQSMIDRPHENIEMYQGWIDKENKKESPDQESLSRWSDMINKEKEKIIPQLEAVQVKEKFGTLRFYLSGYPENDVLCAKVETLISFAEDMSAVTCEECGAPGESSNSAWITTRCSNCN